MSTTRTRKPPEPKPNPSPSIGSFVPLALLLALGGGGGFYYIVNYTTPSGGARWTLFFTAVVGLTGLALPVMAFLNRRFPSDPPVTPLIVLRQALWVGVYFPMLAWLQYGRVLTLVLALLLGGGFIIVEGLLRMRERAQWDPERRV
jgi:hypothetical protein